ncbi:MAG: DUF2330 domain-containing protein, partial [Myxococcales bacterium]|nr:DUF2330 domain-containing protein [Myxococcales bacterium]
APEHRYQVANYPNVTIPTNLVVKDQTREHFGEFYVSLLDHTLAQNPKAVVTEYAWSAAGCDPCPEPALAYDELLMLGANLLPRYADSFGPDGKALPETDDLSWRLPQDFVLTRLHARYDKDSLGEDLVFEQAGGLIGGGGVPFDRGKLDPAVDTAGTYNRFQARYAMLHFWEGAVQCKDPLWDSWGGPPSGQQDKGTAVARDLAFVDRGASLGSYVSQSAHQTLKLAGEPPADDRPARPEGSQADGDKADGDKASGDKAEPGKTAGDKGGCKCSAEQTPAQGLLGVASLALLALLRRRRRT